MEICCFNFHHGGHSGLMVFKTTFCYREFLWFKTHSQIIKYDNMNILRDRIKKYAVLWKITINLKSHAYVFWASSRRHLGLTPESSRQQLTNLLSAYLFKCSILHLKYHHMASRYTLRRNHIHMEPYRSVT